MRKQKIERCIHMIDFDDLCGDCESIIEDIEYKNSIKEKDEHYKIYSPNID